MAAMRGPRLQVGSAAWIAEERSSALQTTQSETEEFSYSARNELEWLNEHMAGIFDENELNIAEVFKTPGKLRGKTPRTARKANPMEARVPLSDVFSATPNGSTHRLANQHNLMKSPQLQNRAAKASPIASKVASPRRNIFSPKPGPATQDSGYFGSQDTQALNIHADIEYTEDINMDDLQPAVLHTTTTVPVKESPSRHNMESPEKTFQTAKEEQTTRVLADDATKAVSTNDDVLREQNEAELPASEAASSPQKTSPITTGVDSDMDGIEHQSQHDDSPVHDMRSPSDGSSPIRPMVRKSSLNFASLPAREPLGAGKSIGPRVSRTSHLDHKRMSYYNRPTPGKSLGNLAWPNVEENEDQDEMDLDEAPAGQTSTETASVAMDHNKTYTQRLQDQITRLGNSQANINRQSKSIPSNPVAQQAEQAAPAPPPKSPSPTRKRTTQTTPGAFPEDEDEDDWIEPPPTAPQANDARPALPKSFSADVMEGIHSKDTIGQPDFVQPQQQNDRNKTSAEQSPAAHQSRPVLGHGKSASVSAISFNASVAGPPLTKAATVANPNTGNALGMDRPETPKSPARSFRDSPLKQVKNKLSSILKSSRGLLASSAAISAEGKSSLMSPSMTRLGFHKGPSTESVIPKPSFESHMSQTAGQQGSPTRPAGRKTRASVEREKEEKRREKEAKRQAEQMDKLDKAREKEREKARVFSKEQDKITSMEKQVVSKQEPEQLMPKETPKPTRTSPRKAKVPEEDDAKAVDHDVEMAEAPSTMPPPSAARSAAPGSIVRKELKRPVKPAKETQVKPKQAPTVIRVNMGSQYHPTSSTLPPNAQDSTASTSSRPQAQPASKASKATLNTKPSTQSLKSSTSSTGRPKALDLAAKKKEQDERDAQRRRDAKAEMERKRAATQEEQRRQEQQRRQETDKQQQKEREQAEAKKNAQRQAALEKAKQTRAPPPAVRSQPNGPPDFSSAVGRPSNAPGAQPPRPQSRMTSNMPRPQEEAAGAKAGAKRTLPAESNDDNQGKRPPSRGGAAYQAKDAKRRRTSEDRRNEAESGNPPNIKGPPVRPSAGFKKDLPSKSVFQNGYSNAPPSATRDLFKATVSAQHNGPAKAAHPLAMAQISKGAIPFAPNPNAAGPSSHKTPARPGAFNPTKSAAKSAPRSSPRFQNGESIELPEIETDDEDEDEDDAHGMAVAPWADSPEIRRALMRQEAMDPSQIFGPPAPLNMEEVFSKSKDRWHKFRARTSSANWSGSDRLTEEDIRKDMVARDKLRREGAWSYEMGRDLA